MIIKIVAFLAFTTGAIILTCETSWWTTFAVWLMIRGVKGMEGEEWLTYGLIDGEGDSND